MSGEKFSQDPIEQYMQKVKPLGDNMYRHESGTVFRLGTGGLVEVLTPTELNDLPQQPQAEYSQPVYDQPAQQQTLGQPNGVQVQFEYRVWGNADHNNIPTFNPTNGVTQVQAPNTTPQQPRPTQPVTPTPVQPSPLATTTAVSNQTKKPAETIDGYMESVIQNRLAVQHLSIEPGTSDSVIETPPSISQPREKRRLRALTVFALSGLAVGGLLAVPAIVNAPQTAEIALEDCGFGDIFCFVNTYNSHAFDLTANLRFIGDALSGKS
jgi:hypothetical protein